MTPGAIANIRLINQQVGGTIFKTAKEIVGWMGAIQAQDYSMAKWAIGLRLPNSTEKTIQTAIDKGEIIRTHILRPTWHFISADDIYWMLDLVAPRIKASLKSRNKQLELTEKIFRKSNTVLEGALKGGRSKTREELVAELLKAKIRTDENRASHLFLWAELEGLICSGASKATKQTYALLHERVQKSRALTRDEALAKIARVYFSSHGPATLQDFTWWSGLSATDSKKALALIKPGLAFENMASETYWLADKNTPLDKKTSALFLLPAFDEFIISYKDRSASLLIENHKKAISQNGIFRPVIIENGKVTGLWKRSIVKDKVIVETDFFQPHTQTATALVKKKADAFGQFLGKKAEVIHKSIQD